MGKRSDEKIETRTALQFLYFLILYISSMQESWRQDFPHCEKKQIFLEIKVVNLRARNLFIIKYIWTKLQLLISHGIVNTF